MANAINRSMTSWEEKKDTDEAWEKKSKRVCFHCKSQKMQVRYLTSWKYATYTASFV